MSYAAEALQEADRKWDADARKHPAKSRKAREEIAEAMRILSDATFAPGNALRSAILKSLSEKKARLLEDSRGQAAVDLAKLKISERDLVERAASATGLSLDEYVKRAVLAYARRDFIQAETSKSQDPDERRAGLLGSANGRIEAAYQQLVREGLPITPARLRHRSKAGFATCRLWLERHTKGAV